MRLLLTAIGLSILGSIGSLGVASVLLLFGQSFRQKLVPQLISYAVGTLLGVAMLAIIPELLESQPPTRALGAVLAGILIFFVLEKLVLWRHCHTQSCEVHGRPVAMVLVGHGFHAFVDGAVIGAAVQTSVVLGLGIATAVAIHEIPQQVGDYAILLNAGYSRSRSLLLSLLSAASAIVGAVIAFGAVDVTPGLLPYALALAAASFLYIALADLIPDLHRGHVDARSLRQVLLIGAGILTAVLLGGHDH